MLVYSLMYWSKSQVKLSQNVVPGCFIIISDISTLYLGAAFLCLFWKLQFDVNVRNLCCSLLELVLLWNIAYCTVFILKIWIPVVSVWFQLNFIYSFLIYPIYYGLKFLHSPNQSWWVSNIICRKLTKKGNWISCGLHLTTECRSVVEY